MTKNPKRNKVHESYSKDDASEQHNSDKETTLATGKKQRVTKQGLDNRLLQASSKVSTKENKRAFPAKGDEEVLDEDEMEAHLEMDRIENKKKREMARQYLESLQQSSKLSSKLSTTGMTSMEGEQDFDATEIDQENIAKRLEQDVMQVKGKIFRKVADEYIEKGSFVNQGISFSLKAGNHTPTCITFNPSGEYVFVGYKSGDIVKFDSKTGKLLATLSHQKKTKKSDTAKKGHSGHVLALTTSPDGKYVVSGGSDKKIIVWTIEEGNVATVFTAHRGAITGLAFQIGTMTMFSSSTDRTIRIWNIEQLALVDTLFGHQDEILAIDSLTLERCISVGARDRTARLWKVPEETQLVFRGVDEAGGSLDTIGMIDNEHFVTGSDSGTISVWGLQKKKPLAMQKDAHTGPISSLLVYHLTDLLISGSDDGIVKIWKIDTDQHKGIENIASIKVNGCINGLSISEDGKNLAIACGRDHRLGRWNVNKSAKNIVLLVNLLKP